MMRSFFCWLIYGHCWDKTGTRKPASRTMNKCTVCGLEVAGPD